jgi:poly(3-hydroxybutyrate) depolymerase
MRASLPANFVLAGFFAGVTSFYGCSPADDTPAYGTGDTGPVGASGAGTTAGNTSTGGQIGTSGASGAATGGAGVGGASGSAATAGAAGVAGSGGGVAGSGGGTTGNTITKVWKSDGFGKPFTGQQGNVDQTLATMGVKADDCAAHLKNGTKVCGNWTLQRVFRLQLPAGYDPMKSYPLLFEGPGCGGGAGSLYQFSPDFLNTVIRVGLQPSRREEHGTNPGENCFDDKEGDDSYDWVFYEVLYDKLNAEVSFDRNRVFAAGNSSGSWFSNELGCKYAGDPKRPVRGVIPNTGGLPDKVEHVPTCTTAGMAGMWVHELNDNTNSFAGNIVAIDRAMKVNKCAQANYSSAQFENFPIGGGQADDRCKRIKNCDPLFPLVVCAFPGSAHGGHEETMLPGVPKFIGLFSQPPLLTQ